MAGLTCKWPCNDTPDLVRTTKNLARLLAHSVQLGKRDHTLVSGNLENAIGRGIHDRETGSHMLRAKFLNDFRAGCSFVAETLASDRLFESNEHFGREPVRVCRKRLRQDDAGHLPMS